MTSIKEEGSRLLYKLSWIFIWKKLIKLKPQCKKLIGFEFSILKK